jgi:hypothetical protein
MDFINFVQIKSRVYQKDTAEILGLFILQTFTGRDHYLCSGWQRYAGTVAHRRRKIHLLPGSCHDVGRSLHGHYAPYRTDERPGGEFKKEGD